MFNLNKKAARKIIGNTMIFGSIAVAYLRGNYYAIQLEDEQKALDNIANYYDNDIHDLRVENEKLRERAIKAEVELAILKHDTK